MQDHRSLEAWIEARTVTRLVLRVSRTHWRPWSRAIFCQLQRSSLSVQLNIAEGYSNGRSRTYARYLGIAYGSLVESIELIELLQDECDLPPQATSELLQRATRCQKLLIGLLKRHRPMPNAADNRISGR